MSYGHPRQYTYCLQEASEGTIELHEDNPECFEFLLKFIYIGIYDKGEIARLAGSDHNKRVLIPFRIYAVADKYDVGKLFESAAEDVKIVLMCAIKNREDILTTSIKAHYGTEVKADESMGRLITAVIFKQHNDLLDTKNFEKLLLAYPIFAADVALHSQRGKILGGKDRDMCSDCKQKLVEIDDLRKKPYFYCPDCGCYQRVPACK
jgi:hypothetical protein